MKKQLEQRLQELKHELESGQKVLAELDAKQTSVRETLLRITGAIQVLEEELAKANQMALQEQPNLIEPVIMEPVLETTADSAQSSD